MQTLRKIRFFKQFVELFAELISLSKNEECYLFLFEKVKLAQKNNSESIYISVYKFQSLQKQVPV